MKTEKEILLQLIATSDCATIECYGDKCPLKKYCSEHKYSVEYRELGKYAMKLYNKKYKNLKENLVEYLI